MRTNLATLIDGRLHLVDEGRAVIRNDSRALDAPMTQIVEHLAAIVALMQQLPEADARRAREFLRITQAAVTVSTCLPKDDQQLFLDALRQARRI